MSNSFSPETSCNPEDDDFEDFALDEEPMYQREITCKRCHGTGEDEDGADCIYCEGWGSFLPGESI